MARKLRAQYPGAIYHAMNRGDRREPVFSGDEDRVLFLDTVAKACQKTDWQIHAWCLMGNHFHLVVETPRANLVDWMQCMGAPTHLASLLQRQKNSPANSEKTLF